MYNYTTNVLVTISTSPVIFEVRPAETHSLSYIFKLIKQYLFGLIIYIQSKNDDIKKKFMLPLTIELQDIKKKTSVS